MRAGSVLLASLIVCGDALRPFTAHHTRAPARCRGVVLSTSAAPDDGDDERQSRSVFTALAAVGAAETGFLSWDKLGGGSGVETLCAATGGGCADVLSGPWASVAGVPLALFGLAAYSSMALLAAAPLLGLGAEATDDSPSGLSTGDTLIAGSATMAAFSGCLILLLLLVIKEPCAFCIGSALLSTSMFAVSWRSRDLLSVRPDAAKVAAVAAVAGVLAAGALYIVQSSSLEAELYAESAARDNAPVERIKRPPTITTTSTARGLAVAEQLNARGARMFGAWWCSHCADQKETLGKEAFASVTYVECAADGANSQRALCSKEDVAGYPSWQIDGKLYPGEKSIAELEEILAALKQPGA